MGEMLSRDVNILGWRFKIHGYEDDYYFNHITDGSVGDNDVWSVGCLLLNTHSNVIDVGANLGYETSIFAKFASKGTTFAFEPISSNAALIKKSLTANNIKNVKVYQLGLGDKTQSVTMAFNNDNRAGATIMKDVSSADLLHHKEEIKIVTLDAWHKQNAPGLKSCDLVKIDIEGHEPEFLRGAKKFIAHFKPALIAEVNHWTLDGLNRVAVPDYIDQIAAIYPYIAAFHGNEWINVNEERYRFLYENMVLNKFKNCYCDFSEERFRQTLLRHQGEWNQMRHAADNAQKVIELENTVYVLNENIRSLQEQLQQAGIKSRVKRKIKRIIS